MLKLSRTSGSLDVGVDWSPSRKILTEVGSKVIGWDARPKFLQIKLASRSQSVQGKRG